MSLQPSPSPNATAAKPASLTRRLKSWCNQLGDFFHSREVDRDPRLKIICGSLLVYYHLTFFDWWRKAESISTLGNKTFDFAPAPIFENLRCLILMDYPQTRLYLYALGMLALLGLFSLFYLRSSRLALGLLAFLCLNKVFFYLGDFRLFANYHHFHLFFTMVFLLSQDKLRFFRGALAVGYMMSAVVKISPSWLFGEYFNSMPDKLPLLPQINWVVTAASVGVFLLEFLGPLCWFTSITFLRRLSLGLFILFHIYSGVIVGYWYTTLMLPLVGAAFLRFDKPLLADYRFSRQHLIPLTIFMLVIIGGLYHFCIPGDVRLTGEGRYCGFFMFDATRQVRFEMILKKGENLWKIRVSRPFPTSEEQMIGGVEGRIDAKYYRNGVLIDTFPVFNPIKDGDEVIFNPQLFFKGSYRLGGDPYLYYFYAKELIRRYQPDRLSMRLDVQLNGHPEVVRLFDIPDFAGLNPSYRLFTHNEWLALPETNSPPGYRWP